MRPALRFGAHAFSEEIFRELVRLDHAGDPELTDAVSSTGGQVDAGQASLMITGQVAEGQVSMVAEGQVSSMSLVRVGDIELLDAQGQPQDEVLDDLLAENEFVIEEDELEEKTEEIQYDEPEEEIGPVGEGADEFGHFLPPNFADRAMTFASRRAYEQVAQVLDLVAAERPEQAS
ncbi:hypothetical protein PHYSODRAFT_253387 [Phytophthora sojae]|uniref:Uncharacterized protein n=1 Tax=Phytophthora sojae (strain P6497) TaxID=1094619 RepID=G4Z4Z7_PHYSP|nr:hypothetical protein PHYSODRAFT_253387 [Phytophthora sojae]EGZ19443.1 hypothetical protein PHYSODRAFT_253387 [Phytophthora sojae]|eukprot:XP_009522160.1 hypothetical protein PHYSODRAFT_253387 [Phytophthora sojae]